jgi:short subunit dehydrogenase-like uncharacterized protein
MNSNQFLLYGANGYTARLIIPEALKQGLKPILAGRKEDALIPLAAVYQLPYKVIDLSDQSALISALTGVPLVLHAAGPFIHTARQMIETCLQTHTHYIDITGEIPVFELARRYNEAARQAGIMILPGAGFDVVPTDCLALFLKQQLPDAENLQLAFVSLGGSLSHGTATTMAESLGEGGVTRENGKLVKKPLGHNGQWVDFGGKELFVMAIPWGDISTAYHTTGIPNIETYAGMKPTVYRLLKWQWLFNWLLRRNAVRNYLKRKINQRPAGPSDEARTNGSSLVWGEVRNAEGKWVRAMLTTRDGYTLTALSSVLIASKILHGQFSAGYQTPASAYGADLVLEIAGTTRRVLH